MPPDLDDGRNVPGNRGGSKRRTICGLSFLVAAGGNQLSTPKRRSIYPRGNGGESAFIGLKPGKRLKVTLFQSNTKTNENPYDARNHAATAFVAVGDSQ